MPKYNGKLLEFKTIKQESDKTFLQVRLSFEEDIEIDLEVDEFTSQNISTIVQGDDKYRYRLSFLNYYDQSKKQYVSTLTKTYLEHSVNISFMCSKEYVDMMSSIKSINDINDLDKLSFISRDIEFIQDEQEIQVINQKESTINLRKSPRLILFSLSAICIMLFSYLNLSSFNETKIHKGALAESIQLYNEVDIVEDEFLDLNNDLLDNIDDTTFEEDLLSESNSDTIELDQLITFSLPVGNVALTFDDGPSQYSKEIADILKEYEVGGTFFFIGQEAVKYPDSVKYIQSNGYSIGSHSMNHGNMHKLSYEDQEIELVESMELLKEITNAEINLFRPPYGAYSEHLKDLISEKEYKMVLWDNDPEDWKSRDSNKIFNAIKKHDVSGSIILMHETQAVVDALPKIIEYLQQLDLEIVNLK